MTAHKHAENMRLYAEDALTTDVPWLLWEFREHKSKLFAQCAFHPNWVPGVEYRRKVKMCRIGEMEFPAPETNSPKPCTEYYAPSPTSYCGFVALLWENDEYHNRMLSRGMVHLAKEAAQAHSNAIINVTSQEKCRG